jgi:S1-C subfamily serine protease
MVENSTNGRWPAAGLRAGLIGAVLLGGVVGGAAGAQFLQGGPALAQGAGGLVRSVTLAQTTGSGGQSAVNAALPVGGDTVADVYAAVSPGVVHIASSLGRGQGGIGSGFVLDKDGRILTNNHVVEGAQQVTVQFVDGTEAAAKVLGRDPSGDLAMIQVSVPADKLTPLTLGDSDSVRPGQLAIAIGNPLGLDHTVTAGVVSAVARTESAENGRPLRGLIQTDAPINPGNSGGPLLDARGAVLGITTLGRADANSIGFALPINAAKRVLSQLQGSQVVQHAYLGISGRDITPALAQSQGLPVEQGVLTIATAPNGPAARAGIRGAQRQQDGSGGDIIVAIDDQAVGKSDDIGTLLDGKQPGDQVTVRINRGGQEQAIQVQLAAWPSTEVQTSGVTPRLPGQPGFPVQPSNPRRPGLPQTPGLPVIP